MLMMSCVIIRDNYTDVRLTHVSREVTETGRR